VLIAALLALQGHLQPADAKRGPGGWGGHSRGFAMGMRTHSGPRFYGSAHFGHKSFKGYSFRHHKFPRYAAFHHRRHHKFHRHRFVVVGFPSVAYAYGYGCQWLKWKAIDTGSPYWWNRYYECIGYY
jgi:hypothetical protein